MVGLTPSAASASMMASAIALNLTRIRSRADDEVIGEPGRVPEIEDGDVSAFLSSAARTASSIGFGNPAVLRLAQRRSVLAMQPACRRRTFRVAPRRPGVGDDTTRAVRCVPTGSAPARRSIRLRWQPLADSVADTSGSPRRSERSRIDIGGRVERRRTMPVRERRQPLRESPPGSPASRRRRSARLEDVRIVLPALDVGERVGADDEEQLRGA